MTELYLAFVVKHFFVDLPMQLYRTNLNKTDYVGSGHQHYWEHALLTYGILIPFAWQYTILIAILDYLLHWHIDWWKSNMRKNLRLEVPSLDNTLLNVIDQGLHQLCYMTYVWIILAWAPL